MNNLQNSKELDVNVATPLNPDAYSEIDPNNTSTATQMDNNVDDYITDGYCPPASVSFHIHRSDM